MYTFGLCTAIASASSCHGKDGWARMMSSSGKSAATSSIAHRVRVLQAHAAAAGHAGADAGRAGMKQRDQAGRGDHLIQRVARRSFGQNACVFGWNLKPRTPASISSRASRTPSLPLCGSTLANGISDVGIGAGDLEHLVVAEPLAAHPGLVVDGEDDGDHVPLAVVVGDLLRGRLRRVAAEVP